MSNKRKIPIVKSPCESCPFRHDVQPFLTPDRAVEIRDSLVTGNGSVFPCHKTINYGADDDMDKVDWGTRATPCAGACIVTRNTIGDFNGVMQIGVRLKIFDLSQLDFNSPVFADFDEFIAAQELL